MQKDPYFILAKYYPQESEAYKILVGHSEAVMQKAVKIAAAYQKKHSREKIDFNLVREGALLHDIGSCMTSHHILGKKDGKPYIWHGVLGREILEKENLPKHALIAERHIGVGITKEEIIKQKLPLPKRDMIPETIEEEIVTYADCFFSKKPELLEREESSEEIKVELSHFGKEKVKKFEQWMKKFGL
ncbi:HD domain-containing protein [Candidatus Woesearchaeota archaeon]|nr:HD domain-containing protein [Candidatus Woesearchaeota archaeon]